MPDPPMRLQDHLDHLRRAANRDALQRAFDGALQCFGFRYFQFALLNAHPQLRAGEKGVVMCTYPASWTQHYDRQGYTHIDPAHQAATALHAPFTWASLGLNPTLSDTQRRVLDDAGRAGLLHGVNVPLHGPAGACATVGMATTSPDFHLDERVLTQLHMLCLGLYNRFWSIELRRDTSAGPMRLSAREHDVLLLLARGHTKADISRALYISVHTVDHHVRNVLKKLNARNATSAVYHATSQGLIPLMSANGDELKTT